MSARLQGAFAVMVLEGGELIIHCTSLSALAMFVWRSFTPLTMAGQITVIR